MRVLSVVSEAYPLVKTGGLADVAGALPGALAAEGVAMTTLLPGYPAVIGGLESAETVAPVPLPGGPARLLAGRAAGLDLLVLDAPHFFARPGGPYGPAGGTEWPDNAQRFAALARTGAELARGTLGGAGFDVLHAHDWPAGLAPAYLHYASGAGPPSVFTVHNLAFQGRFPAGLLGELGLPPAAWSIEGVEYYGGIGFLKAGLRFADRITTVSPTYADEILEPAAGMGLEGLLRARQSVLSGIRNGIDTAVWNPETDPLIAARFGRARPGPRAANKAALARRFGLDAPPERLVFGVVSRLTWQKGLDLLLAALPFLASLDACLVLLGTGEAALEEGFAAAAGAAPGRVAAVIGYEEGLAHLLQAGADALLVPSRFEPCGLTQLCALRYGCLPVVARVGGLADTVIDANLAALEAGVGTGLQFAPADTPALTAALRRTGRLWRDRAAWRRVQENAMQADVSWRLPAAAYAALYRASRA